MDALEGLRQDGAHPEQVGALGRPVARRAHAVVLAGEHHQGSPRPAVRLGGLVHRLDHAVGEVGGQASLGARGQAVADAGVGEGAPDHDPVVAPARPVGVEVGGSHSQGDQVPAGGRGGVDRPGGADVVGGHRVAQGQQDAGFPDRGQGRRGRRRGRRRTAAPGCRCCPRPRRTGLPAGASTLLPLGGPGEDRGVLLAELGGRDGPGHHRGDLFPAGPQVGEEDGPALRGRCPAGRGPGRSPPCRPGRRPRPAAARPGSWPARRGRCGPRSCGCPTAPTAATRSWERMAAATGSGSGPELPMQVVQP